MVHLVHYQRRSTIVSETAIDRPAREKKIVAHKPQKKWGNRDTGELMFYGCC